MASKINLAALTINEEEARDVSQAVFTRVYTKPELNNVHYLMTGVKMKTQIPIMGLLSGLIGKASSGCTPNTSTEVVALSEKFADPVLIDFRLAHCQNEVDQKFKLWQRADKARETWEDARQIMEFLMDRISDATKESILRVVEFGDKTADNVADGGYLTDGVDPTFFTMLNGFWQQIFADTSLVRYTIPENAEATKAAQAALASDRALTTLRYLIDNCDSRVFDMDQSSIKFQVTRSLFNNLRNYFEDKSLGFTIQRAENGAPQLFYNGYEVVARHDWDRNIAAYHNLGTTYFNPNRAIFGPTTNIPIITSDMESLSSIDSFYDKVTKQWYLDVAYYLDAKLLESYLTAVAY